MLGEVFRSFSSHFFTPFAPINFYSVNLLYFELLKNSRLTGVLSFPVYNYSVFLSASPASS
jgi:hypothetical protein